MVPYLLETVSAIKSELIIASSVASTVAINRPFMLRLRISFRVTSISSGPPNWPVPPVTLFAGWVEKIMA